MPTHTSPPPDFAASARRSIGAPSALLREILMCAFLASVVSIDLFVCAVPLMCAVVAIVALLIEYQRWIAGTLNELRDAR